MIIALNPKKGHRFITKGINLTKSNPIVEVPNDLEKEFLDRIYTAINENLIFKVDESKDFSLSIPQLHGVLGPVIEEEPRTIGRIELTDKDDNGYTSEPKYKLIFD